jgi:hypothetical protein
MTEGLADARVAGAPGALLLRSGTDGGMVEARVAEGVIDPGRRGGDSEGGLDDFSTAAPGPALGRCGGAVGVRGGSTEGNRSVAAEFEVMLAADGGALARGARDGVFGGIELATAVVCNDAFAGGAFERALGGGAEPALATDGSGDVIGADGAGAASGDEPAFVSALRATARFTNSVEAADMRL